MLCHRQGSPYNAAELARSLGISVPSVNRYTDTLVDMMLLRRLQPWYANIGKRLIKSRVCSCGTAAWCTVREVTRAIHITGTRRANVVGWINQFGSRPNWGDL